MKFPSLNKRNDLPIVSEIEFCMTKIRNLQSEIRLLKNDKELLFITKKRFGLIYNIGTFCLN